MMSRIKGGFIEEVGIMLDFDRQVEFWQIENSKKCMSLLYEQKHRSVERYVVWEKAKAAKEFELHAL